jgi:hypothetical protein
MSIEDIFTTFDVQMKMNKKTYFSVFFLLCFLASFSTAAYKNLHTSVSKSDLQHQFHLSFTSQENNSIASTEFLFEETESESENDFEAHIHLLPFFISHFQYELFRPKLIFAQPMAEKITNPIYIEVCNFRI